MNPQLFGMLCDTTVDKVYTLSIHAIFFLASSEYNPPHKPQASSLFCVLFSLFMMDMDSMGCFVCPDRENTFGEGLFLVILHHVLLTGNYSISLMTSLNLCLLSPEVIPVSLSFGSLLSVTRDGAIASS